MFLPFKIRISPEFYCFLAPLPHIQKVQSRIFELIFFYLVYRELLFLKFNNLLQLLVGNKICLFCLQQLGGDCSFFFYCYYVFLHMAEFFCCFEAKQITSFLFTLLLFFYWMTNTVKFIHLADGKKFVRQDFLRCLRTMSVIHNRLESRFFCNFLHMVVSVFWKVECQIRTCWSDNSRTLIYLVQVFGVRWIFLVVSVSVPCVCVCVFAP